MLNLTMSPPVVPTSTETFLPKRVMAGWKQATHGTARDSDIVVMSSASPLLSQDSKSTSCWSA